MNRIFKFGLLLSVMISAVAVSSKSYAVPAFSRQMGIDCSSCHFGGNFPLLNAFGRAFKAGGYTMTGAQGLVEGDKLSIPDTLNASLVTKVRYQKTNGNDETKATNNGEMQFPDEAALLIGGRAAEHVGFLLEFATFGTADTDSGDFSLFGSYKMPVVYDLAGTKLSVIPFSTDALGASYGFELLNTGAVRNVRMTEHRKDVSAQQYLGTDGEATGIALVAYYDIGYVNYSIWKPVHGSSSASFLNYLRVAATPQAGNWEMGIGAQLWSGTSTDKTTTPDTEIKAEAWAVDAQAQGSVGALPVGVYITYGVAPGTSAGSTANKFNGNPNDKKAMTVGAEVGALPSTFVSLVYRWGDNGKSTKSADYAMALGVKYHLAQNVQLSLNHSIYSGSAYDPKPAAGDQLTTAMIFAAF